MLCDNIHAFAVDLYKVANDMSLEIISEVFKLRDTPCYNQRNTSKFSTDPIHSACSEIKSASHFGINNC